VRGLVALVAMLVGAAGVVAVAPAASAQGAPAISRRVVTSFDGTPIVVNLFVPPGVSADAPAPLVLQTHGWGGSGQRKADGFLAELLDAGYIVLTWDQRGFGCSGGEAAIDKPDREGRDVSALVDWALDHAPVARDSSGDPLIGMSGGSYAGGIQTVLAAHDPRIDVITPRVSWFDLRYSLYSGEVVNQGWSLLLYAAGLITTTSGGLDPDCPTFPQAGGLDPAITTAITEGLASGALRSSAAQRFLAASGLGGYGRSHPVSVPTLVVQGSTDTLFDLTDGYRIFDHVRSQGVPAKLVVFCGGHLACPPEYGSADDEAHSDAAVLAWLARYLRGDASVDTGATVEYRTNEGVWRGVDDFAPSDSVAMTGQGQGSLLSIPLLELPDVSKLVDMVTGYSGGLPDLPVTAGQLSAAGDARAFTVPLGRAGDEPLDVVGIPDVEVEVSGLGTEVVLMAKLVDREAGRVLNLQEGAVRVPLLGGSATRSVPMPGLAYTLAPGHHLDLQISTASLMHGNARLPATVDVVASASVPTRHAGPTAPAPSPDTAPGDDNAVPDPAPNAPTPAPGRMPATGGGPNPLVPLLLAATAVITLRLRRA